METNKLSAKIAGPAGEGILSAGHVFAKMCSRGGLHVVTENERPSLIRGGHNQFMVRAEAEPISSHINLVNVLLAMDKQSATMHAKELSYKGAIIYDGESNELSHEELGRDDLTLLPIPMKSIIKELDTNTIVENAIALGAVVALLDYDLNILNEVLSEEYAKYPDALALDLKAAKKGFDAVKKAGVLFTNNLKKVEAPRRMLINGLQALNLGAIKAGVSFLSQYPMTPSTGVIQGLTAHAQSHRIAIVQTEDEIASINMALGASYAGVRALTASSGGGYSLMNEGLSLAGATETGIVVVEVQRGGPGTGLPTRTEQSDLQFVLNSGHGEFPHVVIAPSGPASCFTEVQRAFNLADVYQTPVTLLLDRHNAETFHTIEDLPEALPINRGRHEPGKRYAWNDETGISPKVTPGMSGSRFVASGNEHDETGLLNDERDIRTGQMQKRMRKYEGILSELPPPRLDGEPDADVTFVTWGSTKPIIQEARKFLEEHGKTTSHLHLTYLQPFHSAEVKRILSLVKHPVLIENNITGQLGKLLAQETGIHIQNKLLQYDGWPFAPEVIADKVVRGEWS